MEPSDKVMVEIPATLAEELATANEQVLAELLHRGLRDLNTETALARCQDGGISFAAAAELAGVAQAELAREAYVRGIEPPYDDEMVAEELA